MLEPLFGEVATKVLYFLHVNEESYACDLADRLRVSQSAVQKQMGRLEDVGVLVSSMRGPVRGFMWNPRYPVRKQLRALLDRGMEFLSPDERLRYTIRQRPRRPGKPL